MISPTIALDVDDVCADLIGEWVHRYNMEFGDTVKPEEITSWNIAQFMPKATKQQVFDLLSAPDFYEHVWPRPYALHTVHRLRNLGRVIFVTSCHENTMDQKFRWLRTNGFLVDQRSFVAAKDKALIRADYLFDDCIDNVVTFPGCGVLVSHTHNRSESEARNWTRRIPFRFAPAFVKARQRVLLAG